MSAPKTRRPARPYWHAWPDWLQVAVDRHMAREGVSFERAYLAFGHALADDVVLAVKDAGFTTLGPALVALRPAAPRSRTKVVDIPLFAWDEDPDGGRPGPAYRVDVRISPAERPPYSVDVPWLRSGQSKNKEEVARMTLLRETVEQTIARVFATEGGSAGLRENPQRRRGRRPR
jgi:hypothetical protein